jgi:hypothetical protein
MFLHYTQYGIGHPTILQEMTRDYVNVELADSPDLDLEDSQNVSDDIQQSEGESESDEEEDNQPGEMEDEGDEEEDDNNKYLSF